MISSKQNDNFTITNKKSNFKLKEKKTIQMRKITAKDQMELKKSDKFELTEDHRK